MIVLYAATFVVAVLLLESRTVRNVEVARKPFHWHQ